MKIIAFVILLISLSAHSQIEKKVCFLGNSYTYTNDLPKLISDLADADGNTLVKDQNTPGGYTLEGHSSNATSLSKIASNNWDFVVLQDQSQLPSFPWEQVTEDVFPYGEILSDSIRSANECAVPLFFNTWGRRDGDDQWDSINTFTKMNQRLYTAYSYMADKNSGMLAPAGIGFEHIANDGTAPITHSSLYVGDGSHPSVYGSYLAACIFYEVIFEENSEGNTFYPGAISATTANYIQTVAHHVLTEVDSITIDYTTPVALFNVAYDGTTASFTNTSEHAFEFFWEFGDGATSTEENPVHIYADLDEYTVTLTATYCDKSSTVTGGTDHTEIKENELLLFTLFPNPSVNGTFTIRYSGGYSPLHIFSLDGQLVIDSFIHNEAKFELPQGIYFIKIGAITKKLVVNGVM